MSADSPSASPATVIPTLTVMGTGTSVGVPVIGCRCAVCTSTNPRNHRTRSGVLVRAPEGNFVIDTSPELRMQLLRERVELVHAALFTHAHADHIFGLDDLRIFGHRLDQAIPLHCEAPVEEALRRAFHYAFSEPPPGAHHFAVPRLRFERIELKPFPLLGLQVQPIRLQHGKLPVLGYRIGRVAFCTDVSSIPEESWPLLEGLDTLFLDTLREHPHPTHLSIEQSLAVIERLQPRQTYLTHIGHWLEYEETNARLPASVELAWDGLTVPL
ncbi:MAG: MBL fold metallo-hydrolase [Planctomycetaceae bacterium]|nr:MBL fold metallo-hydrolase [Planctomycetaceae bacterium]